VFSDTLGSFSIGIGIALRGCELRSRFNFGLLERQPSRVAPHFVDMKTQEPHARAAARLRTRHARRSVTPLQPAPHPQAKLRALIDTLKQRLAAAA
jgi:hypothetical protein